MNLITRTWRSSLGKKYIMAVTGCALFGFVIAHLAGNLQDAKARHDIYRMMLVGFKQPLVSGFYILGMALLCLHLSHGASSMFQSMGWKNKYYGKFIDKAALVAAILIFLGYCSIPLAVLSGMITYAKP